MAAVPRAASVRERKVRHGRMENNVKRMCYPTGDCFVINHRDTTIQMLLDKPVTKKLPPNSPLQGGKGREFYLPKFYLLFPVGREFSPWEIIHLHFGLN